MPDQEPRTGGVAVTRRFIRNQYAQGFDYAAEALRPMLAGDEPGIWFPLAEAEALIDPSDPAVRERAIQALAEDIDDRWSLHADDLEAVAHEIADAVLAALRGAK